MINQIVIQRTRPLTRDYTWICTAGPDEFRRNVFTTLDVTSNGHGFPVGTEFININWPEIRRVKNLVVDIDFLVRCPRGQSLYQAMEFYRRHGTAAWFNNSAAIAAINLLREHVRSCPECKSAIQVITRTIGGDDGDNW